MLLKRTAGISRCSGPCAQTWSAWRPSGSAAAYSTVSSWAGSLSQHSCSSSTRRHQLCSERLGRCSSRQLLTYAAAGSPGPEAGTASAVASSPPPDQEPDAPAPKKRGRPAKPKVPKPPKRQPVLDPSMPALETVPPVLPAAPRSILRLLDEEPDRFTTITKIKEFKGSLSNKTLMGHLLVLLDRGKLSQDKLLSLYRIGTHQGQMQYDHVADAVARCSKVRAKVKRWAAAAELLASEHPAQYAAQEKEQPGITELQAELVGTLEKRSEPAPDAAAGSPEPSLPVAAAPSTTPALAGSPLPPGTKPKALRRAQSIAAGKPVEQIMAEENVKLNTVLQSLIDITKEGVVVDPDALYAAFRLDGVEGHVRHQDVRQALSALEAQGQEAGSDAMRFYHGVRAHMGQHMGPEVRDRLSAQELQTAEQGGMDGKLLTIAQIRIMYYLTQQEAQEQAQSGAASRQAHSQHAGGGQQLPTQRSPSPAPPRQGQAGQKEAPPASRGRLTVAPWEVKGPIHRPGTAGKATRKA